jgi:hypothetical protein
LIAHRVDHLAQAEIELAVGGGARHRQKIAIVIVPIVIGPEIIG